MNVSNFLRLHTNLELWSLIIIIKVPLALRTTALAGPQQCAPAVFLRVPKNITNAHTQGLLYLVFLHLSYCSLLSYSFRAVYWIVYHGSIECGVIGGEAGEHAFLPFVFLFIKRVPKKCYFSLSLVQNLQ